MAAEAADVFVIITSSQGRFVDLERHSLLFWCHHTSTAKLLEALGYIESLKATLRLFNICLDQGILFSFNLNFRQSCSQFKSRT
jgi:hypothetical protein